MKERPLIKLEFGFSTSPNYDRALAIAQELPGYRSWGEGRKLKHAVPFVTEQAEKFVRLAELAHKWKATTFWLDDKELDWWTAFTVPRCIERRLGAYESSTYCRRNNYWGCRQLPNGLTAGQFDEKGAFHVDGERFLFEYEEWLELLSACPFFNRELVLRKLEELDKVIDPRTSDHWDYYRGAGGPSGRIRGVVFVPHGGREADFATLQERGEKAWRTRVIAIPDERWLELSEEGHIPEADVLLEQGWYLVSVAERGGVWYCVLQRA